jgi:hypothetical protein
MTYKRLTSSILMILASILCLLAATQAGTFQPAEHSSAAESTQGATKPITNSDIVRMAKAGLSEDQITWVIRTSATQFDLSPDALIQLKTGGVSQKTIDAMLARASQTSSTPLVPIPSDVPTSSSAIPQPYVVQVASSGKSLLATHGPVAIQTKVKGDNMATIAASEEVRNIASNVITSAAVNAVMVLPGVAGIPVMTAAGGLIKRIPIIGSGSKVTVIYAFAGRKAPTVLSTNIPKFEVSFGDVVGANPDNFEPILIKLIPTDNNWRLAYAEKTNAKYLQSDDHVEHSFIEDRIPIRTNKLERGHVELEPQQPLDVGEYAIVMRPVNSTYKISFKDIVARAGEGLLIGSVWDFSVAAKQ